MFKKVGIIGVGFMGGSFALAFKERYPHSEVSGYARSDRSYRKLRNLRKLDHISRDLTEIASNSDLLVLASPVSIIGRHLRLTAPFLKRGAVVIDMGSTKLKVEKEARKYLPGGVHFVGCHPLCGSELRGAEHARKDLYKNSLCILTSRSRAAARISRLWKSLGSRVSYLSCSEHDRTLAYVSHLPHVASFAMTHIVPERYAKFISGSFRDMTRVSASSAALWADILLTNRDNLKRCLKGYIIVLERFQKHIEDGRRADVRRMIERINQKSRSFR